MSEQAAVARFVRENVVEPDHIARARQHARELGANPVSTVVGAQLAFVTASAASKSIIEIGTGAGVSGLWLLHGAPGATLTTIDNEPEHLGAAREAFQAARVPSARVRWITGRSGDVLPRMNEAAYDIVLVDGGSENMLADVEHGLRLARPGGVVLVPRVLAGGRVADPVARDELTASCRTLLSETREAPGVVASLFPAGEGLLQLATVPTA
ncbi:O-methyltransferase [Microbacterium halophytorum]|uniref:O-methyltransferase n=1 Tax=Microbacterium halophytorum TaxID=2067568 RepID=UPI000CFAD528|nr:class I SAM-dependent methyltransferase [Microbacterium halophytorum]